MSEDKNKENERKVEQEQLKDFHYKDMPEVTVEQEIEEVKENWIWSFFKHLLGYRID